MSLTTLFNHHAVNALTTVKILKLCVHSVAALACCLQSVHFLLYRTVNRLYCCIAWAWFISQWKMQSYPAPCIIMSNMVLKMS